MADYSNQDPTSISREAQVRFEGAPEHSSLQQTHHPSSASAYADLQYLFDVRDQTMIAPNPNRNRNRRKSDKNVDHAKHRRTRSGCYTCRARRVKCDEAHPVCERCKKGSRECVYPEKKSSKGSSSSKMSHSAILDSPGSSSDEDDEEAALESQHLQAIPDNDEEYDDLTQAGSASTSATQRRTSGQSVSGQKPTTRQTSEVPSLVQDKGASPTPSTEGSIGYPPYQTAGTSRLKKEYSSSDNLRSDWSHLPPDLQYFLTYFYDNVTQLHYSWKFDPTNFLKTVFIDAALRNEALLYAVVGFAAFQRTLHNPDGRMQDFLQYYNKAVSLLLRSLKKGEKHRTATILAILQLATIEEFLGDWINLLGHQKAAYQMLTELYTPQTIMENENTRVILGWYMRFDVFAGLMGGFEMVLSREWFSYSYKFLQQQVLTEPGNLNFKIEASIAKLRLIAMDMSTVFAKMGKAETTLDQFLVENKAVARRIEAWYTELDPALHDPRFLVTEFTDARSLSPGDIVNPYLPGIVHHGPLWAMNVCIIDWYSIDLMHRYQTALTLQTQPGLELELIAYKTCQLYEAVEFFRESPPGTVLSLQASLGIACLFLPRDDRHAMWARRKLAGIESHGYIYPYTFRTKMADLFRDRSCMHWWLPNDEDYPPIIRSIRRFVEERTSAATSVPGKDLRDMKAIFASLNLDDGDSDVPTKTDKGKAPIGDVAVAETGSIHDMGEIPGESVSYGFYDGRGGYWGEGHHRGP